MNYQEHYNRLIERARWRSLDGYVERHHVKPKCLGGSNDEDNIVRLTPEEHYVAHQLLVKLYPKHLGIVSAAHAMTTSRRPELARNKLFGWLRRRMSEAQTGQKRDPSVGRKIADRLRGKKLPQSVIEKMRAKTKGQTRSEDTRKKMSQARLGFKPSAAAVEKMRASLRGKKQSAETKAKRAASMKGRACPPETRAKIAAAAAARVAAGTFKSGWDVRRARTLEKQSATVQ